MQNTKTHYHNIILGGGASGLACAARLAAQNNTLVLEGQPEIGMKVKISGGGKCNFTNLNAAADKYLSANPHFVKSALARLKPEAIIKQLKENNIKYEERADGRMFAFNAAEIADMLLRNCRKAGVKIQTGTPVTEVDKKDDIFYVYTAKETYSCKQLIVATGGLSYPQIGASDIGYKIARRFGHKIIEPRPALSGLIAGRQLRPFCNELSGLSVPVTIRVGKQKISGDLLFTHVGISGPAVLNTSLYWLSGSEILIDFLNGRKLDDILQGLTKQTVGRILCNFLPERLVKQLVAGFYENIDNLSRKKRLQLEEHLTKFEFHPEKTTDFRHAEVTSGGVDTTQISSATMESKLCSGLFFIGEVLDVTGQLGGFNLHWAWASANAAAPEKNN